MTDSFKDKLLNLSAIDLAAATAHDMRPPQVVGMSSFAGVEDIPSITMLPFPALEGVHLDAGAFLASLHVALKDVTVGYVAGLRQGGSTIGTMYWNWAKTPEDGSQAWASSVSMHIASCSKLVTAIAMTRLLADKGISPDTPMYPYLPSYWSLGANVEAITFAQLLTHTSGLNFDGHESDSDYGFMKDKVAAGTNHLGDYHYQNMNFGLCRILITTMRANTSVDGQLLTPSFNASDSVWDYATIHGYLDYVDNNILQPSGVFGAGPDHPDGDALAYGFPPNGAGLDTGDLSTGIGGFGWHMSCDNLLQLMNAFRRSGAFISPAAAQAMLDRGFGLDVIMSTPLGTLYNKNGGWGDSRVEQSQAYFLPDDMELVVFTNSPITSGNVEFRRVVTNTYLETLSELNPAVVARQPGTLDVVARGTGAAYFTKSFDGTSWGTWQSIGGKFTSGPAIASWAPDRLDVVGRGTDMAIWHGWRDGNGWHVWDSLGGEFASGPTATSWGANRLDIFAKGIDYAVWHTYWDGNNWHGWESLGATINYAPAAVSDGNNSLHLFAIGTNDALWHNQWLGIWLGWESLGGKLVSAPAVASRGPGRIDVFARSKDSTIMHKYCVGPIWHDWEPLAGEPGPAPAATSAGPDRLDLFAKRTDNAIWHTSWDGTAWQAWDSLGGYFGP